jgi:hypothetical protein
MMKKRGRIEMSRLGKFWRTWEDGMLDSGREIGS